MKKITTLTIILTLSALLVFAASHLASAQMMGGYYNGTGGYAPGSMMGGYRTSSLTPTTSTGAMDPQELAGQALAQKLQAKTITCSSLSQSDYESLGEYYMGLMMGANHDAMDSSIVSRYGQSYDDQMHIAMGERFSGCNVDVQFPSGITGFGPMMMGGSGGYGMANGWGNGTGYRWGITSGSYGLWIGGITIVLFWAVLILAGVALFRYLKRR